jgi:hypothetical protein
MCSLTDRTPKQKGKVQNPENFAPGCPKWRMENAKFNLYGLTYRGYHILIKIVIGDIESAKHDYETSITKSKLAHLNI